MRGLPAGFPPSLIQRSREGSTRLVRRRSLVLVLTVAVLAGLHAGVARAAGVPVGTWVTQDGDARVRIEPCEGDPARLCGRIAWVAEPPDPGAPSPVGVRLLSGFAADGRGGWDGGEIVDPRGGRAYKARMRLVGPDRLEVSGCFLFLCAGQTWTRYAPETAQGAAAGGGAPAGRS